jgi:transforming growth factor-beta-induced protein
MIKTLLLATTATLATANLAIAGNCSYTAKSSCSTTASSCSTGDKMAKNQMSATIQTAAHNHTNDIVDIAVEAGSFKTLVAAAKAAGLVDVLKSDGPFTVFAPTDDAFAKLPKGTVESLLKPENRDQLRQILLYHVVPGKLTARDVTRTAGAETAQGQRVSFDSSNGVKVDNARVIKADIEADNGVIHVIDRVILPESANIVDVAKNAGTFNTLLAAAIEAGLADVLAGDGPLTVFAPSDAAFAKLPSGTVESLLKPENRDQLVAILTYHVVPGRVYARDAVTAGTAKTVNGQTIAINIDGGSLTVDSANIVATDIDASNGVIHVIDQVILPQ